MYRLSFLVTVGVLSHFQQTSLSPMGAPSSEQRCASQMPDVCTVAGRSVLNNNPSTFSCSWHRMGMPHQWGENYGRSEMQLNRLEGGENESSRQYFSKRKRKKNIYGNLPCTRQYAHSFCVFYSKFATYKVSVIGLLWQKKKNISRTQRCWATCLKSHGF